MRELNLSFLKNKKPYYLHIAESLRSAIIQGQLQCDESLPSTRILARMLKVHRHTVMAALEELVAEGWIVSKERQHFQVSNQLPSHFFKSKSTANTRLTTVKHKWKTTQAIELPFFISHEKAKYNFQSGLPDLRLFPHKEFRLFLDDAFKDSPEKIMGYSNIAGYLPFIEAIKLYLRRVRAISNREIIVTHGSQEGIFVVAQLLLKPGDLVAVEKLGYPPAWEAMKVAGAKLVPIDVDQEGLDPDSLEKILKKKKIRLIYVTPLHQYPTTVTLTMSRRLRLYELANQYGVPILEDDYDHEFHYRSEPIAPIASHDPSEQIIYVSTFSKILYPSTRLGFLAVPASIANPLRNYKRIVSRQNDMVLQDAVARWINAGGFERHLRRMRRVYEERRETILACVTKGQEKGLSLSYQIPDGGMAIWLNTHTNADRIMQNAAKLGVRVTSESFYSLNPNHPTHLRLGFANQTSDEIKAGMDILFKAIIRNKR